MFYLTVQFTVQSRYFINMFHNENHKMIARKKAAVYEIVNTKAIGSIPDATNMNEFAFTIGLHTLRMMLPVYQHNYLIIIFSAMRYVNA